jgi:hypothetical protein
MLKQNKVVKKVKDLVIGGNLEALEFAFREGFHVFYENLEAPFHLEQTKKGINKKDIVENYAFLLSLSGLNLHSHLVSEYRLGKEKLTITGKTPWILEVEYENLHDFRKARNKNVLYKVVDYINVRSCGAHDIRELKTEDNFVKEVYFYPSERANTSKKFSLATHNYETVLKDAIVVSYLNYSQIENEDFSPIYSRLRLKELMKEAGIKGKKCGINERGKQKHNAIKLEFAKREINEIEQTDRQFYYTQSKHSYLQKLFGYLYGRK